MSRNHNLNYSKAILESVKRRKEFINKKIELCTLRLEVALTKNAQYVFPLVDGQGVGAVATERRLQDGEIFTPFAMALKHYVRDKSVPRSEIFTPLNTFIDKRVYTTTNPANTNPNHLESLYNADITFTRNNVIEIPAIHTADFKEVPNTQSTTAFENETTDGFMPILETKMVFGNSKNEFKISCLDMDYLWQYLPADQKEVRLVLLLKGFKGV